MSQKVWLIVVLLSLVLATDVQLKIAGSGSLVDPHRTIVISNPSGKRLSSVFYGARIDTHYAVFKRLSATRHPACGGPANSPSVWTKLLAFAKSHGIWSSSTVYAQSACPQACGYSVIYTAACNPQCGDNYYEGDLYMLDNDSSGIGTGSVTCTAGGCPGETPTINCACSNYDDGDDDSIFDQDDQ